MGIYIYHIIRLIIFFIVELILVCISLFLSWMWVLLVSKICYKIISVIIKNSEPVQWYYNLIIIVTTVVFSLFIVVYPFYIICQDLMQSIHEGDFNFSHLFK
jgi:hypothetical protein